MRVCACACVGFAVLHACTESFGGAEDSRHHPVFVFTPGSRGGPEWAERTVSKSKPIRTHFFCTPPPLLPSPHHPVASPRTDDVTDCCEHCFHGNAHHRFGLHFRQLSLPPFSLPPPPIHSLSFSPSLPTAQPPPHHSPDEKGGGGGLGHWRGGGHREEADRRGQEEETTFTVEQKARLKKFQLWTGCLAGRAAISRVFSVHNSS